MASQGDIYTVLGLFLTFWAHFDPFLGQGSQWVTLYVVISTQLDKFDLWQLWDGTSFAATRFFCPKRGKNGPKIAKILPQRDPVGLFWTKWVPCAVSNTQMDTLELRQLWASSSFATTWFSWPKLGKHGPKMTRFWLKRPKGGQVWTFFQFFFLA